MLRKAVKDNQLATAEVAGRVLEFIGESENAAVMELLFASFKENYLLGKERKPLPADATQYQLQEKLQQLMSK